MKILFVVFSLLGSFYFLFKKRKADLYTLAFFSALIYFSPGFFGYVVYPGRIPKLIHEQVYVVFTMVIVVIIIGAMAKDVARRPRQKPPYKILGTEYYEEVLAIIGLTLMLYQISKVNRFLLSPKNVLMPLLGSSFVLMRYSASLAFLTSFMSDKRKTLWASSVVLVFTFLIGFRGPIALTGLALILLVFSDLRAAPLVSYYKFALPVGFFGYFMAMGKVFYGSFKAFGLRVALSRLFDFEFILIAFMSLEPFSVQTILNEIIVTNFHIGFAHLKNIIYQVLVVPSLFGADSQAFNIAFQTQLFPEVKYGMAYNIWGEALASGGYPFLLLVVTCYVIGLSFFDRLQASNNPIVQACATYMGVYWGFFIHRSSIATQLTYQRHLLYVVSIGVVGSMAMCGLRKLGLKKYYH